MRRCSPVWATLALLAACGEPGGVRMPEGDAPARLSAWKLFEDIATQSPAEGVIPYAVNNPLFTDYAVKHRFLYVPEGEQIDYRAHEVWQLPVGSILVKTFAHLPDPDDPDGKERLLETRLLVHTEEGWEPEVYVYGESAEDAQRTVSGEVIGLTRKAGDGTQTDFAYAVPTRSECRKCHGAVRPVEGAQPTRPLGPSTAQLDRMHDFGQGPVNQIDHLDALGLLDEAPAPQDERFAYPAPDDPDVPVAERARAYLASNCAHCHAEDGETLDKDLWLDYASTAPDADPYQYGVCKKPTSAGNADCSAELDIVPGKPDESLLVCRMELLGKGQMAPLGRSLVHAEGVALVRAWIEGMDLPGCRSEP